MMCIKLSRLEGAGKRLQVTSFLGAVLLGAAVIAPAWRVQASDSWPQIKITTQNAGLHHVMAADLAALIGVSSNDVQSRILQGNWQLLNRGQPEGWLAGSNGVDLIFYAGALRNNYTTNNVYWLVDGTNLAPAVVDGGSPAAVSTTWYLAATNCEQDIYCRYELGTNPDSNYWYWANVVAGHPLRGKFDVTVPLDALGDTNALARITVRVCGATTTTNTVGVSVNGTTNAAWVGAWTGAVPAVFTFNFSASLLKVGNNTIRFTALGTPLTQWWLDGFLLEFPRPYAAVAGALQCSANSNAVVTMTGFNNNLITVLDVSQPLTPAVVTNLLVEPDGGQWRASFVPASGDARYSAAQAGSLMAPLALEAVQPLNLASPTNHAACVIIAPAALQNSATNLANYRNAQGLETRVIPLEAIYNEFNGGLREPDALCAFLAQAHNNWQLPPTYVVLAGNGTYDYRNLQGMNDNLMPPLMIMTLYGLTASDSEFGDLGGTNYPEIAVGRLPATNAVQLTAMINKIKAYEALPLPATNQALLVADFNDPQAGDFPNEILVVQGIVTPAFQTTTVLPSTAAQMHNQVLASLNAGEDLMCYLGHGASTQFGSGTPGYLSISDLASLSNSARLPFIVGITCLAGSFAQPGSACLGQTFVSATNSGAIAVLSASGFSIDYEALDLNWALTTSLADGSTGRLGDFVRGAMINYNQTPHYTPSGLFNLMGDPALRLRTTPAGISGSVKVDLNGNGVADAGDTNPIVQVEIKVYTNGTTLVATATNDSAGSFNVVNLLPGNYTVVQTVPPGYQATTPTTVSVTLTRGSTGTANFLDAQLAGIAGMVLVDMNGDGVADAEDTNGISGVIIVLQTTNGVPVATNLTSDSGAYFTNVPPGGYTVVQMAPPGWLATTPTTVSVTLTRGSTGTANFLDMQPADIAGSVKLDVNGNGIADANDTNGVSPVVLNVYLNGATLVATVTNSADGSFAVNSLPPGSYTVVQAVPSGWLATTPTTVSVTLTSGSTGTANFLDTQPASIAGMVLVDVNGDGVADADDTNGISGVTIVLQTTNGVPVATNLTSDSGAYFTNVPPGSYTVVQMAPPGWLATTTTNIILTLTSGQASTNNNFLDTQPAGIAGSVLVDVNGDGVANAEDTNGVSPVVLDVYLNGATLVATVTNSADGSFAVNSLPPGSYTVMEMVPPGWLATTLTNITVTLTSGSTGTANYLIDTRPLILAITLTSTQGSLLTFRAGLGQNYTVLAATNLLAPITAWSVVSTGTAPVGPFVVPDLEATNFPQRFYRVRSP